MERKTEKIIRWILLSCLLSSIVIIVILLNHTSAPVNYSIQNEEANSIQEKEKNIVLAFYDKKTNCSLDGNLYFDEKYVGQIKERKFETQLDEYSSVKVIKVNGTTNSCFEKNANLPFTIYFENLTLNKNMDFEAELNPRFPSYPEEMQKFVKPEEVVETLEKMYLDYNLTNIEAVEKIFNRFYMNYASDSDKFGIAEFWQTPKDYLTSKSGDCEDWAIMFLSLIKAHNPKTQCYLAIWDSHANVICNFNQTFIIYDQDRIRKAISIDKNPDNDFSVTQENKIKARGWKKSYFEAYGLDA